MATAQSSTKAVSVTTSGTVLVAHNTERTGLIIYNNSSKTVFIGTDSSDDEDSGIPLAAGDKLIFDYEGGSPQYFFQNGLWGTVASGTANVRVMELSRTRSAAT